MSRTSMISNTRPTAATPQISSTAKVKDSDMVRSLVGHRIRTLELDQPAFHDRAGSHVGFPSCHRPAVERRPRLRIAQTLIERPGSGIIVLNQHPGEGSTMIDDLALQGGDQLSSGTQGLEPLVHSEHPDAARILRRTKVHATDRDQPVVGQATHTQRDFAYGGSLESLSDAT